MISQDALIARLDRAVAVILDPPSKRKAHKARRAFSRTVALMSLPGYLAWLNRDSGAFSLTEDLDHWAQCGITTAAELGAYLDRCVRREREKDERCGYYEEEDAA